MGIFSDTKVTIGDPKKPDVEITTDNQTVTGGALFGALVLFVYDAFFRGNEEDSSKAKNKGKKGAAR